MFVTAVEVALLFQLCFSRLFVVSLSLFSSFVFPSYDSSGSLTRIPALANWDGTHYSQIAQCGYDNELRFAFSPMLPWASRGLASIFAYVLELLGNYSSSLKGPSVNVFFFLLPRSKFFHFVNNFDHS